MKEEEIKKVVRDRYARAATQGSTCCQPASSCCGGSQETEAISKSIGYSDQELGAVPEGANLGLGCGNPLALASLQAGETVLDLGSGAGFDCFLASRQVGKSGKIIGVDMTPEMLDKARANARKGDFTNVEFRLGEIENLPVADKQADIVISNCVINLSPAKERVFQEAFRTLKPGGRLMVSDIVLRKEIPEEIRNSVAAYTACVAGAVRKEKYLGAIRAAGFQDVEILQEMSYPLETALSDPNARAIVETLGSREKARELADAIASIKVYAKKPNLKREGIRTVPAARADEAAIQALLAENDLPGEDIGKHLENFILAMDSDTIVGCIGLEIYGAIGFVRSLAVKAAYRHQGIAEELYRACEKQAGTRGVRDLYLLTATAEAFFAERGWTRIDRELAPEAIRGTEEFKGLCPASAICMWKSISIPEKRCRK